MCLFSFVLTGSTEAIAEYTPTLSMLHTSGKYIYNEENERITLRGTNLRRLADAGGLDGRPSVRVKLTTIS